MAILQKAESGSLSGHTIAPINLAKFAAFKAECYAKHVSYGWGMKDPNPGSGRVGFTEIDCSGFVRTLLMYACEDAMDAMPDGSYTQGEWLAAKGFKPTDPANCGLSDGHLRINVHHPDHRDEAGHIWIVVGGATVHSVESFGGHGPGERTWNAMLHSGNRLSDLASVCYVLM